MPGVPSNKACERCKKKHLKEQCDETRPKCQRCANAGAECPGYVQTRKFIDQGATVRRRYAPYRGIPSKVNEGEAHEKEDGVRSSESAQSTRQETGSSVNQASHDVQMISPVTETSREEGRQADVPLQTQGAGTSDDDFMQTAAGDPQRQAGMPRMLNQAPPQPMHVRSAGQSPVNTNYLTGFEQEYNAPRNVVQDLAFPITESPLTSTTPGSEFSHRRPGSNPEISGSLSNQNEQEGFHDIFSELMTGTEHEVSFLTRHFSEFLGPWLDLSDSARFFAVYAPIRALNYDFLKYAMAALAAKHLGRLNGQKPLAGGNLSTSPASMEVYPNATRVDWILKGANYYYIAFSNMRTLVSDGYGSASSSAILESPIEAVSQWLSLQAMQTGFNELSDLNSFLRKIEALLATCVILTMYRLLDAPGEHWQSYVPLNPQIRPVPKLMICRHLVGIGPLFDALLRLHTNSPSMPPQFSHGARAAFYNFARQDYLGSYFSRTPTYVKQENLPLWNAAGIQVNEPGPFESSSGISQEDLAANNLIWLMHKVVNFLAEYKRSQIAQWTDSNEQSQPTTTTWINLCIEFQTWLEKVPETFRPSLRIERPRDMSNLSSEATYLPFPEVFYSLPSCAAAMQHYHFGRLGLLLNRPPDVMNLQSTAFDRLASLREVTKEVDYRCREVCGIALSRPRGEVRLHMVPLLFAVGQCLETAETRQVIVDLLRGTEADLGLVTEFTVEKLQTAWDQSV